MNRSNSNEVGETLLFNGAADDVKSTSVAEKRLIFERLSSRKTSLIVAEQNCSTTTPPPKPKRTFAHDHYFSLNNVDTTTRKNVEKLNITNESEKEKKIIDVKISSSVQQPKLPKLIVCRPIVKRWNTTTTTTATKNVVDENKLLTNNNNNCYKNGNEQKNCSISNNSSSCLQKILRQDSSAKSTTVVVKRVVEPPKRPKYFQLSHEYEQIFADRTPSSRSFNKRSASLEEIYSSPIPSSERQNNNNNKLVKNNNNKEDLLKNPPSLYYCSSPVPAAPVPPPRKKDSSNFVGINEKKPSSNFLNSAIESASDFITPLTSRPIRPKRTLRNVVVVRDSKQLLFRDNNNTTTTTQTQNSFSSPSLNNNDSSSTSAKFYSPKDEIRKLKGGDESEGEEDDDEEEDNSSTSSKDKEIERRVRRARVVRRQTLMHYDQQETAFRRRKSPQLFELAALIELRPNDRTNPVFSGSKFVPAISYKFPQTTSSTCDTLLASLPCLCYPDVNKAKPKNPKDFVDESFVITITDQLGDRKFAYCCRYVPIWRASSFDNDDDGKNESTTTNDADDLTLPSLPQVLCVVTPVQAAQFYLEFAREGAVRAKMNLIALNEFLRVSFYKPLPPPGGRLVISGAGLIKEVMLVNRTTALRGHGLSILLERLNVENILILFASLLSERRVLIVGDTVPTVSKIVQAATMMLYPFEWPHTLIPVIPDSYVQLCFSPTPYLIGVLRSNLHELKHLLVGRNSDGEEEDYILIYDLDYGILKDRDSNVCTSKTASSPTHSSSSTIDEFHRFLPSKICRTLKQMLKSSLTSGVGSPSTLDGRISESFVTAFVDLVGHYCEFVVTQQDGHLTFQKQNFIQAVSSKSHKMFLKWFVETGMFQIWIRKRLDLLAGNNNNNNTKIINDAFDKKVVELKSANSSSGSDLFGSVAKRMASFLKTRK